MAACDVKVWIDRLQELGFTAVDEDDCFVDFAVTDRTAHVAMIWGPALRSQVN